MGIDRLDRYTQERLRQRNLVVRRPRRDTVQICVDDGSREGFRVGWAEKKPRSFDGKLAWQSVYRDVPGNDDSYWRGGLADKARYTPLDYGGIEELELAVREILDLARWGDVLAAREIRSGAGGTYTATMDETQAEWLAGLAEPKGITHLGGGRIRLTAVVVALFRGSPDSQLHVDAHDVLHVYPGDPPVQLARQ
ncbi:hypothetical protein FPZ12_011505 [Amycolatopsis acidicola]|uniref:Uncharacterized protein n=1 Tax=Amycolatopsis acidicola TaxID=2596893 RepID=A0A5N0VDD3_9PSEU|nr:hypothetical protein [Amycolatopsis acidicola]KAA9162672.1 hypothetical protein FPZ12_011505 [Amycolatopsis acidicola]